MRKNTKVKVYTIYTYNTFNNDYIYLKEYYNNINKFLKEEDIKTSNPRQYYYTGIDTIDKPHLLKDKYLIIKSLIDIEELL